jgi:hypothetical protein
VKKASLNTLSTAVIGDHVYVLLKEGERLLLSVLNTDLEFVKMVWSAKGNIGFILKVEKGYVLISLDDELYLVKGGEARVVLVASNSRNMFWHLTEGEGKVFIHEYGLPPTAIYSSKDLERWEKVVANLDIDKRSKHFHEIAFDPYRKWLISTLGDGCLTRVAVSEDLGSSWRPLYRGSWQFVPIVVLKDIIVFGMDTGIAKGGVGIYYPDEDKWEFIFLKWMGGSVKHAQFCDLKFLSKGLWIASLGTPQAVMVSSDLRSWYPLFVESFNEEFNHKMLLSVGRGMIACSTGKTLLIFNEDDVKNAFNSKPLMVEYKAYRDKLIGYGFLIKHSILDKIRR